MKWAVPLVDYLLCGTAHSSVIWVSTGVEQVISLLEYTMLPAH